MSSDYPSGEQLCAAIDGFLRDRLLPAIDDPSLKYGLRVCLHSLGIVQRQLAQGEAVTARERDGLQRLLGNTEEQALRTLRRSLCALIARGEVDIGDRRLLWALQDIAAAKLAVDNPKYRPVPVSGNNNNA